MRFRNTILALAVLAGLGVFIYYYEYRGEAARDASAESEANALNFEREKVRDLELTKPGAETLRLSRQADGWSLDTPIQARADDEKVSALLNGVGFLRVVSKLDGIPEETLGEFGLKEPAVRVKLTLDESAGELILHLGDKTPIGNEYYARKPGAPEVLLVSGDVSQLLSTDAASLRYKKLVGIDAWKVARFQIEKGSETVGFVRGAGAEEWRLEKPLSFPADGSKVQGLWIDIQSAEATGFDSDRATASDLSRLGLDRPALTITIEPMSGADTASDSETILPAKSPVRLLLSQPDQDGTVHARRDDMPVVMRAGREIFDKLDKVVTDLTSYRDQRAAPVDRWKLSMVELQRPADSVRLFRNEEDSSWRRGSADGATVPPEQVNTLIDAVEAIKATGYIEGASAHSSMGGDLPAELSVILHEGSGESARTVTMKLHFPEAGSTTSSALRRVTSSASNSIYLVPGAAVQALLDQATALAQAPAEAAEPSTPAAKPGETKHP